MQYMPYSIITENDKKSLDGGVGGGGVRGGLLENYPVVCSVYIVLP